MTDISLLEFAKLAAPTELYPWQRQVLDALNAVDAGELKVSLYRRERHQRRSVKIAGVAYQIEYALMHHKRLAIATTNQGRFIQEISPEVPGVLFEIVGTAIVVPHRRCAR